MRARAYGRAVVMKRWMWIAVATLAGCVGEIGRNANGDTTSSNDAGSVDRDLGARGSVDGGIGEVARPDAGARDTGVHPSDAYAGFRQNCAHMHPGHPMDGAKEEEHQALLALFPSAEAAGVVTAVRDGSWFSPQTWATGEVPSEAHRVLIPCGRVVWYDGKSAARLDRVAVDGILHFATEVDTELVVDTLLTSPRSILTIGLAGVPVRSNVKARIVIHRANGPLDPGTDPKRLTKGVVTHGTVRIFGHDKVDFLRTNAARAGDTVVTFADEPRGWQAGDKLVVAATSNEIRASRQKEVAAYRDEVVTVQGVERAEDGSYRVSIAPALVHDHVPPTTSLGIDLSVPVANFTRNVFFGTETDSAQYLSDGKTVPTALRGHVMFMHNRDVVVENAEFFELGRTDKALPFSEENVAGRYAVHFHRTGVRASDQPARAVGNAVWGSPGWGIVHHDAHLDVLSNAVFGVVGSGIVAEAGNETGDWFDNIVVQTVGVVRSFNAQIQGGANVENEAAYQAEVENNSFLQGEAFGMKSRLLRVRDNVAASANGAGFSFWPHGTTGPSHIGSAASDFEHEQGYDPYYAQPNIYPGRVATRDFIGNEVLASRHALNTSANKEAHRTDLDILVEDLLAWNVDQPIMSFYQQNYIIKDSVFIRGVGNAQGFYYNGTDDGSHSSASHIHDATDFKLVSNRFEGFDVIAKEPIQFILGNTVVGSTIEAETGAAGRFREGYTADNDTIDVLDNSAAWVANLPNPAGTLQAEIDRAASTLRMDNSSSFFSIFVDKADSLGREYLEMGAPRAKSFRFASPAAVWPAVTEKDGYYQQDDGTIYMVLEIVVADRLTGTVGRLPVAVELAFLDADPSGLPTAAVNRGPLPAGMVDGVGAFEIIDERRIGEVGNRLQRP